MTDEEKAQVRIIIREVLAEERAQREKDEFHIRRRDLYDTHQRTLGIFAWLDKSSEIIGRTIVMCVIAGIIALIAVGSGKVKL